MRPHTLLVLLLLLPALLPLSASAQLPPPSPPGIRYALGGHADLVYGIAVSTDGQTFASVSADSTVKVWRTSDGMLLHTYASVPMCSVAFSPDGTTIAAGDYYGGIWIWRLADDSLIRHFAAFSVSALVTSVSYSMDDSTLAASGTDTLASGATSYDIKLFGTANWKLTRTLTGHTATVNQIAFSPTSKSVLASASNDLTVRIWNTGNGTAKTINAFTSAGAACVAISHDGNYVAAGGQDSGVPYARVWKISNPASPVANINAYTVGGVAAVAFSPKDGTLLATTGNDSGNVFVPKTFNIATGSLVNTFPPPASSNAAPISAVAFSTDGNTLIATPNDYSVVQWNVSDGTLALQDTQFTGPLTDVTFLQDGSQMAVLDRGTNSTRFFEVANGGLLSAFPFIDPFRFSPDGTLFAYDGFTVFNLVSGSVQRNFPGRVDTLVWISADDQTFYTYDTGSMTLNAWSIAQGILVSTASVNAYAPVTLSSDQTRLAGQGAGGGVTVWSMPSGVQVQSIALPGYLQSGTNIVLSNDGGYVAFAASPYFTTATDAYIYRIADGAMLLDQPGAPGTIVMQVALSPFGDSIAAYRSDGSVTVTAINPNNINGTQLAYWNDQFGTGIAWMGYTPDAASIVFGRNDATLLVCYNPAPAALASLTLSQSTADGGAALQGTVSINQPAPAGGVPVQLSSSNPAVASVPSSTLIAQNATSAILPITTSTVTTPTVVTISASLNGITRNVSLTLNPAIASKALAFAPSTVQGGIGAVGVVTLLHPALGNGQVVALSSANPGLVGVPATVTVPAGKTSARFLAQTGPVATATAVAVTATSGNVTVKGTLNVVPATVAALSLLPASVQGGVENAIGIVTLSSAATTDVTVNVSVTTAGTAGDVTYPASLVIPAGSVNGTFDIGTNAPKTSKDIVTFKVQITGAGAGKTANMTVTP